MSTTVKSRIWISSGTDYSFPEQQLKEVRDKPPIGLCFSGGGTRAMSASMGQLRALTQANVMPYVRYISCVSGGSWATIIYSYYSTGPTNDAELLGPVTKAPHITQEHLDTGLNKNQLAYGATRSLWDIIDNWGADIVGDYTFHDVWNCSVGQAYLYDFGAFGNYDYSTFDPATLPYFSYDQTTVDEIKANNPDLKDKTFLTLREGRPFPIINSTVLLPQSEPAQRDMINFEYTPLTVGRPYLTTFHGMNYGGGFIEPFAYRTKRASAVTKTDEGNARPLGSAGYVTADDWDRHFSLTETTGTSSAAYAQFAEDYILSGRSLVPQAGYWGINGTGPYTGATTLFGDGGLLENNGLIPLIQRGVELAIVFINTQTKLDPDYVPSNDPSNNPSGKCDVYLPPLFGYSNHQWTSDDGFLPAFFPNNQVFPSEDLPVLLKALKIKNADGEPMIVAAQHKVQQNDSWGVVGGNTMTVVWCYLDRSTQWESQLPADIRDQIEAGNASAPSGDFIHFPNYLTVDENGDDLDMTLVQLTRQQVTLLADFACDCVLNDGGTIVNAVNSFKNT